MQMRTLLSLLLLTGCGLPELSSEDVFSLEATPRAWIYGTAANAQTNAPLGNATIQVASKSTLTDANGAFRLEGLSKGDLELVASLEGFETFAMALSLHPGGNRLELRLVAAACGPCGEEQVCVANTCTQAAVISGDIVDACSHQAVDARVTVGSKSVCSATLKGIWQLRGLQPGGPQTLAVGREGYQAFSTVLTLKPGFNALEPVLLQRLGGCAALPPVGGACTCTAPGCQ